MIHEYPYTDFHEMNLDWIIREMKKLVDDWASFATDVTASAHESTDPEVTVTGDLKTAINFDFGLVKGPEGPEGPEGPQGKGLDVLGVYATLSDLQTAHPTGTPGDVYLVGSGGSYTMYVWSEDDADWVDGGPITSPAPAISNPLMDGLAAIGTSQNYAREDHVHPSDTSKQDVLVSGTNIKTINSNDLLGSGDITVQDVLVSGTNIKTINSESLLGNTDISLQTPLVSGVNIKTVNTESILGTGDITVQETLVSGTNIKTINSESLLGSTDIALQEPLVSGTNIKTINNNSILGSGDLSILPAALTVDTLWTNANPSSAFAAQTLTIDLTGYEMILVNYKWAATSTTELFTVISYNEIGEGATVAAIYNARSYREFQVVVTGLQIADCYHSDTVTGTMAVNNNYMVPYKIYGIK